MDGVDQVVVKVNRKGQVESISINGQPLNGPSWLISHPTDAGTAIVQLTIRTARVLYEYPPKREPWPWLQRWKQHMFGGEA